MSQSTQKRHFGSSRRNLRTRGNASRSTWQQSSPPRMSLSITAPGNAAERYSAKALSFSSIGELAGEVAGAPDLLLQQQNAIQQRLGGWRTARHIDVDRHDPVAAAH